MFAHLIPVFADVFDVADRLKGIDERYRLFYNKRARRYEVYTLQPQPVLQAVLPFSPPDARCLEYVRKTRIERVRYLQEELEKHNAEREKRIVKEVVENIMSCAAKQE